MESSNTRLNTHMEAEFYVFPLQISSEFLAKKYNHEVLFLVLITFISIKRF